MGSRTEKLLVEDVEDIGYAGLRVDFTGGGGFHVPHDAGDIIVGKPREATYGEPTTIGVLSDLYVIEEKYKSTDANKYLQEDKKKFDDMIAFARAIGATPVLAVRWSSNLEWSPGAYHLLRHAEEVRRTSVGNVNVSPSDAEEEYETVEEFF